MGGGAEGEVEEWDGLRAGRDRLVTRAVRYGAVGVVVGEEGLGPGVEGGGDVGMGLVKGDAVMGGEGLNQVVFVGVLLVERPEEGGGWVEDEERGEIGAG